MGNFGFTLCLFFYIRFCFFICVEWINKAEVILGIDAVVMTVIMVLVLVYVVLILVNPRLFKSVNEKINLRKSKCS